MLYKKELLSIAFNKPKKEIEKKNKYLKTVKCEAHVEQLEKSGEVLMVDIFATNGLLRRYCTDKNNTITYDFETKAWKSWTFLFSCDLDPFGCGGDLIFTKGSKKVISDFLEIYENREIEYALNDINREKLQNS